MPDGTTKDFGPISGDYEFFLNHSTEHAEDLASYLREFQSLETDGERLRMLDFGCGDGRFTETLLRQWGVPGKRLELSLVEPQADYRRAAAGRLQTFARHPLQSWSALPSATGRMFDLVLSNHVLYYVPDLARTVAELLTVRSDDGLFVTAMAGRENALIQFWIACFAMLDRPLPYHLADDLETALQEQGVSFQTDPICYELRFDDREEYRASILRFLLGEHFPQLPRQAALDLFEPYVSGKEINMSVEHRHFVVKSC